MADNSLTIDRNRFLALVLKSPTQMGWLSIINSVTNISRLGTFKELFFKPVNVPTVSKEIKKNLVLFLSNNYSLNVLLKYFL